jgi:hypothetical protein
MAYKRIITNHIALGAVDVQLCAPVAVCWKVRPILSATNQARR